MHISLQTYLNYFYFLLASFILQFWEDYQLFRNKKKIDNKIHPEISRFELQKQRFLATFVENDGILVNYNSNIDAIFYEKKNFNEFMRSPNHLEKTWKTRILFETTPRGNIIMYYDPYKLGFAYYSDQNTISYDILNAAAMKYVILFRCRDFFMDESVYEISSPLIQIHLMEEKKEVVIKDVNSSINHADAPFAKFRNYGKKTSSSNDKYENGTQEKTLSTKELMKNKFIYIGNMRNFQIIQPIPKKRRMLNAFSSTLMDGIVKDSEVQKECLSYNDYKKLKNA